MHSKLVKFAVASTVLSLFASFAAAQVDSVVVIADKNVTTGGVSPASAFGAYGYVPADPTSADPTNDKIYAVGFNGTGQDIRVIEHVSSGTQTFTRLVTNTPYLQFTKSGDLNRGGGTPTPGSLVLNKVAVGSIPAYGAAFISDGAAQVTTVGVGNPELSQRIYRYNLAQDTNGDARDEITSLVTLKQMQDAIGTTNTSSNVSRQVALSTDSTQLYYVDTSTAFGGLWRVPTLGGAVTRLFADPNASSEPSVVSVGGSDHIVLNGTAASGNAGGLDYYDTADSTRKTLVSAATLAAFMETNITDISIPSTGSDAAGNVYFNNTDSSPERRGIYKLDPQGRLIKIASQAERTAATTGTNSNTLRMQPRTTTFTGPNGSFPITQVLYSESSPVNAVAGAYVFKPGDFNRDNAVTSADLSAFGAKLTVRGVASALADSRYDLNGNNVIDWKDVKILQSFLLFPDGDSNFDFKTNFDDLLTLARHYAATSGQTWVTGDYDGDNDVDFDDLLTLARNYDSSAPGSASTASFSSSFAADWKFA